MDLNRGQRLPYCSWSFHHVRNLPASLENGFWLKGNLPQNRLVRMAALKLSTGVAIQSDHIQQVEYYPSGSLWLSCGFTELADQHFLYIRTSTGTTRVMGRGA